MNKQIYKGQEIVIRVLYSYYEKTMCWYCDVGEITTQGFKLKRDAINAAKEIIDNPLMYGIELI